MMSSERSRSASDRSRPSLSSSVKIRIWDSGVRSSWETLETKSERIAISSYSRRICSSAVTASRVLRPSSADGERRREDGNPADHQPSGQVGPKVQVEREVAELGAEPGDRRGRARCM